MSIINSRTSPVILLIAICTLFPKLPPAFCSVDTFSRLSIGSQNVRSVFKTTDKRINPNV